MKQLKRYAIIFVLFGLIVFFSIISPHFFTQQNLTNIFVQQSYVIIAAIGLSFVMISGGMDLSIGYQISAVGVTTAVLVRWIGLPFSASLCLGLAMGTALGALNGLLSVSLKVHTLIVTLGTMTVFQGLSYIISRQSVILNLPPAFKFFGQGYIFGFLPFSVVLMIISVILAGFILNYTRFGRQVYGVGSNEETARLSGVNVNLIRIVVFSICGFFVALSSIVLFGRSGSASSSTGPGVEFTAMTSAILGGISFTGGEGKMWGLVTGVLILGVLSNGMQLVGLNTYVQYIVKGFVLLLAVGFDLLQKKGIAKASIRTSGKQA